MARNRGAAQLQDAIDQVTKKFDEAAGIPGRHRPFEVLRLRYVFVR
jgi:hypothetical protein